MPPKPNTASTTSHYRGVTLFAATAKYQAFVKVKGTRIHLGMWTAERDAAIARDRGVLHFGLDRDLNLPHTSRKLGPASPEQLRSEARRAAKRDASSQYLGVSWDPRRRRWAAVVCVGERRAVQVAQFDNELNAAVAYDRVARKLLGARAALNFPDRNLQPATMKEIRQWSRKLFKDRKTSRFRGVQASGSERLPWRAVIFCAAARPGRDLPLGSWGGEVEAATAYDRAALFYLGANATLNFPDRATRLKPADSPTLIAESWHALKATLSSRFRGVHFNRRSAKWIAKITQRGRERHLGAFEDERDAATAYDAAAIDMFGDKARPNFHPRTGEEVCGGMRVCDLGVGRARRGRRRR